MPEQTTTRFRTLLWYVQGFGIVTGLRLFRKLHPYSCPKREKVESFHLPPYPSSFNVRLGTSDVYVFEEVFLGATFDLSFLNLNPKLIIDGGANIGLTSAYFAYSYPKAEVLAVEPERSNFQLLVKNTSAFNNIMPIQGALWNRNGTVQIKNANVEKVAFQVDESTTGEETQTVQALTIDKLLEISGADAIDILKLDVEGAEVEIFGANYDNWLPKTKTIIIELHDRFKQGCSKTVCDALRCYDFGKSTKKGLDIFYRT